MPKRKDTNGEPVTEVMSVTSLRLTRKEHEMLKRVAAYHRRSQSNELRYLIERAHSEMTAEGLAA